ncbi:cell division topological specificity factor MinE [Caldisericum exile]|uniref:Cell division topological specificity factor n=1 Tax=Caldisericum exile (strain DSM 21853 / NBRC 104410 / AZM16c01) TaxID=511051 RepID=A0A7U6GEU0_CALEA|nr:cell division topological specificity factor MinE [Caldisericum exile]BAL81070.1 cell division topological specificity factor [Caldisericum exile AZM16c01]
MNIFKGGKNASDIAQERLKLILIQDRLSLSSKEFEMLKEDIIKVLSKYFDIEENGIKINLERTKEKSIFEAIVPLIQTKKEK